jgi:hypothetical protein
MPVDELTAVLERMAEKDSLPVEDEKPNLVNLKRKQTELLAKKF